MPKFQDLTGQKFGILTVKQREYKNVKDTIWLCQCDCGKMKEIRATHLKSGATISCGCLQSKPGDKNPNYRHGGRYSPEYWPWQALKDRCVNKNRGDFQSYGGRGITVCERWRDSFENFFADMGPRPSPKHSVDRIDVNGNYEPGNCRWASISEQSRNKRARKDSKSGVCGVNLASNKKKWVAIISVNGKRLNLGTYETLHNAIASRWVAEATYWGKQTGGQLT
jgi:hypothetical protein